MDELLLDTHAWIWLVGGQPIKNQEVVESAGEQNQLLVSPVSCWEVGMLAAQEKILLAKPAAHWVAEALRGLRLAPLTAHMAVQASFLPGMLHKDPADRLLVSTARSLGARIATRDARILSYAAEGHLKALEV